jgi:hypothetical protein
VAVDSRSRYFLNYEVNMRPKIKQKKLQNMAGMLKRRLVRDIHKYRLMKKYNIQVVMADDSI